MLYGSYIHWDDHAQYELCDWCEFKGDNLHVLFCQMSGLVENFNTGIFSDTINVINIKLCMMVPHINLYLFFTLFSELDTISKSQQCQAVLTENFLFLLDFAWWYYSFNFTRSFHCQWPWPFFKVTAALDSLAENSLLLSDKLCMIAIYID